MEKKKIILGIVICCIVMFAFCLTAIPIKIYSSLSGSYPKDCIVEGISEKYPAANKLSIIDEGFGDVNQISDSHELYYVTAQDENGEVYSGTFQFVYQLTSSNEKIKALFDATYNVTVTKE